MKTFEYLLIILTVLIIGCTFDSPYRTGMKFFQWETVRNTLVPGTYDKDCVYTNFTDYINYNYDCNWSLRNEESGTNSEGTR